MMTTLLKPGDRDQCDFTCFDMIMLGGSAVPDDLVDEIKVAIYLKIITLCIGS